MTSPIVKILVWLGIGVLLIGFLLAFLPDIPFPNQVEYAMEYFFEILWDFDFILPVASIFTMVYISLSLELSVMIFKLILWLVALFSGQRE